MTISLDALLGGARLWVSGETVDQYEVVKSPADGGALYVRTTASGSGATDPASDTTNYRPFGARPIKSIQRGTITVTSASSATATITSVNTAKCELRMLGYGVDSPGDHQYVPRLTLTNSTTITATRNVSDGISTTVSWELTEFY